MLLLLRKRSFIGKISGNLLLTSSQSWFLAQHEKKNKQHVLSLKDQFEQMNYIYIYIYKTHVTILCDKSLLDQTKLQPDFIHVVTYNKMTKTFKNGCKIKSVDNSTSKGKFSVIIKYLSFLRKQVKFRRCIKVYLV